MPKKKKKMYPLGQLLIKTGTDRSALCTTRSASHRTGALKTMCWKPGEEEAETCTDTTFWILLSHIYTWYRLARNPCR